MIEPSVIRSLCLPWIIAMIIATFGRADAPSNPVAETMDGFASSIRLRGQLADEKMDWSRQERILRTEIEMLEAQVAETRRRIESIRSEQSEVLEERDHLLERKTEEETIALRIESSIKSIAEPFRQLAERLPDWVKEESDAPDDDSFAILRRIRAVQAANERVQTMPMELIDPSDGESIRVDLLSFGLGGAFFTSPNSGFGGRFVFDGTEWSTEIIPEFAAAIRAGILQEEGLGEPQFLLLPVSLGGRP